MRRAGVILLVLLVVVGGAAVAWRLLHREPEGQLRVDWEPSAALAPGVSVREGKVAGSPAWRVVDLTLDPSRAELQVAERPGGDRLEAVVPAGAVAAVNGGYFDARFRPTGWLLDQGQEKSPRQNRAQGGVLALGKGKLYIGPIASLPFTPEFALQNSPRLVEPGGAVGIRSDDKKRAPRTFACDVDGRLHLVVVAAPLSDGPTLLESARFLAAEPELGGLGCQTALNLDGGPSTGIWLPSSAAVPGVTTAAPIGYALAVLPR